MNIVDDILKARGYTSRLEREVFLSPDYDRDSHDPFLLPDMARAVKRLVSAQKNHEKVVIYGDYDIDGLTASTILFDSFKKFGISAEVFIPNRFIEGYGLAASAIRTLSKTGATVLVTVDCGSLSHTEVQLAEELGMDVIVTDHHAVGKTKSSKTAMINPKWLLEKHPDKYDDMLRLKKEYTGKKLYPFLDLAGCGVAFKLVQALQTKLEGLPKGQEKWLLDLVAFGTVCDVVRLVDENRLFAYWGLAVMKKTQRMGLKMLMAVARITPDVLDARALGFGLGPRVNASGRLDVATHALDLLTTDDRSAAYDLAERLDTMNTMRRAEQDKIYTAAVQQAEQFEKDNVLVVSDPAWNHGIVGIVAAKLLEKYHKPTFVLQELADGTAKGSARSFGDFSAVNAIRATEPLIIKGGGHTLAAGVTLQTEHIGAWRQAVNTYYKTLNLNNQTQYLRVKDDVTLETVESISPELMDQLRRLEPYGNGNPTPVFKLNNFIVQSLRNIGSEQQHRAYVFSDSGGGVVKVNDWQSRCGNSATVGDVVDAWVELVVNNWQGRRSIEGRLLQLEILT